MKRTVLVTGAAGFIGRHVAQRLMKNEVKVIGLDRVKPMNSGLDDADLAGFVTGPCDRNHLNKVAEYGKPDAVIHCAGSGSVAASFENPFADFQANVGTTMEVFEFARQHGGVAVVIPSSAAVYGATPKYPQREDMPLYPVSPYGAHKVILEDLCHSYASHFHVPVAAVRLFSVYGAGLRKQLLWDACRKASAGEFSFAGTGEELRDWLHVTDAARLLILAAEKASTQCPIVNGGTGRGTSIRDILIQLGAIWNPQILPSFTGQSRQGDPAHYVAEVSKVTTWGFVPQAEMETALQEYVRWFREEAGNDSRIVERA